MTHSNFIVARLHDVDFNRILQESLAAIAKQALEEQWPDGYIKLALTQHMVGASICRDSLNNQIENNFADYAKKLLEYFDDKITVEFTNKRPEGNGYDSAYFDVNLKQAFLF
tara:strand:+ start:4537 stop:4872 length:336 start_codon:yes stop_codon:yes gene_type:complete